MAAPLLPPKRKVSGGNRASIAGFKKKNKGMRNKYNSIRIQSKYYYFFCIPYYFPGGTCPPLNKKLCLLKNPLPAAVDDLTMILVYKFEYICFVYAHRWDGHSENRNVSAAPWAPQSVLNFGIYIYIYIIGRPHTIVRHKRSYLII